ncbi:MAG TPA: ABC transporter permease [Rudaea sp.]
MPALRLALHFVNREVRSRYLGSFSGGLWALLQPLIQLSVYGFVWVYVFKMGRPDAGAGDIVPFLALGLWPWNALSESLVRSSTAIQDNAALIGKVALPREVLVFSCVAASFLLHGVGFIAIVAVFALLFGTAVHAIALPLALLLWLQLFLLALGLSLLFSAIQVFVRDLAQVLAQVLPLWMFLSPVLYQRELLPEKYRPLLDWNPFTFYPESMRALLLGQGSISLAAQATALVLALVVLGIGFAAFRRLSPHFEDFL